MSIPPLTLEIAFGSDPGDAPVWTALPGRLRGFTISRGRNHELDQFQAGRLSLILDNRDRALDPEYAAGAYYGDILPMRRVRLSCTHDAVTYRLFTGFAEGYPQTWPGQVDAVVSLTATDGFKVLALKKIDATYSAERSDERVAAVLDDAGWPAADRDLSVGQSNVQAATLAGVTALAHIQLVEASEQGRFYIAADGDARFLDRHTPILDAADGPAATFGDGGGDELGYIDPVFSFDDATVWNEITVSRSGAGTPQTATDATSIARYFGRTLARDTLLTTDGEAANAVAGLLLRYAEPHLRVQGIGLLPEGDVRLWPVVLGLDIGASVAVYRRPPGGGDPIIQYSVIEAIAHSWAVGQPWVTAYQLSSLAGQTFWLLGVAGASEIEATTVLGY